MSGSSLYEGVARLLADFAEAVDRRRAGAVAALFCEDALFRPRGEDVVGRPLIEAMYATRFSDAQRRTRHVWSNLRCERLDEGEAAFSAILTVYAFEPQTSTTALQMRMGDVEGLCVRDEAGAWWFARQVFAPAFRAELPLGEPPSAA